MWSECTFSCSIHEEYWISVLPINHYNPPSPLFQKMNICIFRFSMCKSEYLNFVFFHIKKPQPPPPWLQKVNICIFSFSIHKSKYLNIWFFHIKKPLPPTPPYYKKWIFPSSVSPFIKENIWIFGFPCLTVTVHCTVTVHTHKQHTHKHTHTETNKYKQTRTCWHTDRPQ